MTTEMTMTGAATPGDVDVHAGHVRSWRVPDRMTPAEAREWAGRYLHAAEQVEATRWRTVVFTAYEREWTTTITEKDAIRLADDVIAAIRLVRRTPDRERFDRFGDRSGVGWVTNASIELLAERVNDGLCQSVVVVGEDLEKLARELLGDEEVERRLGHGPN